MSIFLRKAARGAFVFLFAITYGMYVFPAFSQSVEGQVQNSASVPSAAPEQEEFVPTLPAETGLVDAAAPAPALVQQAPVAAAAENAAQGASPLPESTQTSGEGASSPAQQHQGAENLALPAPVQDTKFDENLFFDAESLVPKGELSRKGAPSKVDPSISPASRLVVSIKDHDSNSKEARFVAADRAMKLGRYESALEIYDVLYTKDKTDPNILLGRAIALQSLNRDDEAIKAYEDVLAVRPNNVDAQINLNGLIGKHYPAVALKRLREIYQKNPGNIAVVAQIAVTEAKLGHYQEAVQYLGTAASMEPQNANHVFNMAVIADRAGDKKSAIKYYEEALEVDSLYGSGRTIPRESVFARLAQLR